MNMGRPVCGVLLVLVVNVAAVVPGCKPKANSYAPPPPPDVTVAHPIRKVVTRYLEYTGTTEAYESAELRARVVGFLQEVRFKPGSRVKKGEVLFTIDPRVYEAAAQQAQAEVATRGAALKLAQIVLERTRAAAVGRGVSQLEVDRAIAECDQAQAQVELAKAALATAKLNVEFAQVAAPFDGRVSRNYVDVGNLVGGGEPTALALLVNDSPLYVGVDVSEADLLMVRRARLAKSPTSEPGQAPDGEWRRVDLATADSSDFSVRGHIDYVEPALNPQTGTIRVRSRFENADGSLLPGLFVRLRMHLETAECVLAPELALLSDEHGRFALVVDEAGKVEVRRVKIGSLEGDLRVVAEGLNQDDKVIVGGLQRARPGSIVKATLKPPEPSQSLRPDVTGGGRA